MAARNCRSSIPRRYGNYTYRRLENFVLRCDQWLPLSKISSSNAESNLGRISLNVVEKKGMRIVLLIAGVGLRNPAGVDQASN
jgi:hypothetical protein